MDVIILILAALAIFAAIAAGVFAYFDRNGKQEH